MAHKIFIAGAGGIGRAAALILTEYEEVNYQVTLGDIRKSSLDDALSFVEKGNTRGKQAAGFIMSTDGDDSVLNELLSDFDVILDCLPGSQAPRMARLALDNHCHYANLTEYVAETNEIMELAKDADTAFVLQTGLAPGFINILAMKLFNDFLAEYKVTEVDRVSMKVGALSQHAAAPHFYAFTWSPIGVATEYLKDAIYVEEGETKHVPALSGLEELIIDGMRFSENYTSGGAADLPDALAGKTRDLDYKTLRYPGHYEWVKEQLDEIGDAPNKIEQLQQIMLDQIPMVEDDVVVIYTSVMGKDHQGILRKVEKSYHIFPCQIGNQVLRAIQSTTAAPLCEMAHMMLHSDMKGVTLQSQINPDDFMDGDFVSAVYGYFE